MAETNEALIPYPHNREIVLRQQDSVIVYDPASKQLEVRNRVLDETKCPYCHQPLHGGGQGSSQSSHGEGAPAEAASFASPDYFRMLQHGRLESGDTAQLPSFRRRLTHDLGGGSETPPRPLPEGEFVGSSPAPPSPNGISSAAFSPNYFHRFFREEKELGRGGKGVVLLVKHVLDGVSLGHFALKRIPVGDDHQWLEKVLVEVQLLQHLSHQNLVSYRHVWLEDFQISQFGPSVPCAFILQQFCNAGDLHGYVLQGMETTTTKEQLKQRMRRRSRHEDEPPQNLACGRRLKFDEIRSFFKDITAGLDHLHQNSYIHRDLKPSNCLLHDSGKGLRVLVSDFGEVQSENQVRQSSGSTGTISYCAPEVLRIDPNTGVLGNFTTKSDIFSLGLILYFMTFARLPYSNADTLHEENEDIELLRAEITAWAGVDAHDNESLELPDRLFEFLGRLLALDPNARPTSEDTLHTIKTAGVEASTDGRPRFSSTGFEHVRRRSRFSPTDGGDPLPDSPSHATRSSEQRRRSSPPGQLDLSPRRRPATSPADVGGDYATTGAASVATGVSTTDATPPSASGSLVLRSRHATPLHQHSQHLQQEQHLLPTTPPAPPSLTAPPSLRGWGRSSNLVPDERMRTLRVASLLLKLLSLYVPCQPVATRPDVGLALLGLATVDLLLPRAGGGVLLGTLGLHAMLMGWAWHADILCLPPTTLWREV